MTVTRTCFQIKIEATPHPALSPNSRMDRRKSSRYRKEFREFAYAATHNLVIANPWLPDAVQGGALELAYTIYWENGRTLADPDNAAAMMKFATDQIARKLEVDDRHFLFHPIKQEMSGERQGWIEVQIVVQEDKH